MGLGHKSLALVAALTLPSELLSKGGELTAQLLQVDLALAFRSLLSEVIADDVVAGGLAEGTGADNSDATSRALELEALGGRGFQFSHNDSFARRVAWPENQVASFAVQAKAPPYRATPSVKKSTVPERGKQNTYSGRSRASLVLASAAGKKK
jgi:hypothetical protein